MNTNKINRKDLSTQELKHRLARLTRSMSNLDQSLRGSLITRYVKCGKPNCRCAKGEGHPSLYLSTLHQGKTRMDYVPAAWESWVRERLDNHHAIQEALAEITELNLELLRRRERDKE